MIKLKLDIYQNSLRFVWEFHFNNERHRENGMPTVFIFDNINDKEPLTFYHDHGNPCLHSNDSRVIKTRRQKMLMK